MTEEEYKKELAENGVEVQEEPIAEEPEEPKPTEEESEEDESEEEAPLTDEPKKERKRSIYDEYKDTKRDLKSEKAAREELSAQLDAYREKYGDLSADATPEERQEALDEIGAFAQKIGADPATIREMRSLFLKDAGVPADIVEDIKEFKTWKEKNQEVLEKQQFEQEFKEVVPTIRELFPTVSQDELDIVKEKIDELAHSKDWHDRDLDYIVFKNKAALAPLISPRKRGMENKGRNREEGESTSVDLSKPLDYSTATAGEIEAYEKAYKDATRSDGLSTDGNGKKILI